MADWPTVDVVIPFSPEFTPTSLLERAKSSASSQDVPTNLIVVKDTASNGPAWARNRGIERTNHRYVAFLDADDEWHEDKLERQLTRMEETGAGLCVEGIPMDTDVFMRELYLGNLEALTPSILIDTSQVDVRFDETIGRREDHLFMLEAAAQGGVCLIPDLFTVGRHDESFSHGTTHRYRLRMDIEFAAAVREQVPEIKEYVSRYYRRPRCRIEPVVNTPGDAFRMALIRTSPLAIGLFPVSLFCQRIRRLSR